MKKLSLVLVAAGLMSLAACGSKETPVENTMDAVENQAESLDNMADAAMDNAMDAADNMADAAENAM